MLRFGYPGREIGSSASVAWSPNEAINYNGSNTSTVFSSANGNTVLIMGASPSSSLLRSLGSLGFSPVSGPPLVSPPESVPSLATLRLNQAARLVSSGGPPLDSASQHQQYRSGLITASALLQTALAPATIDRQDSNVAEFWGWLERSRAGVTPANCTADDVVVYIVNSWQPNHRARDNPDSPAGISALKSHLSALSGFFRRIGRTAPFNPITGEGNPCDSPWVEDLRAAYARLQVTAGCQEESAVPMTEAKYITLVGHMWAQVVAAPDALTRILTLRDLLCVHLLWQTAARGHAVGKLGLGDFVDPSNTSRPYGGFPLPAPVLCGPYSAPLLCFRARGTKTYKLTRAPPVFLAPKPSSPLFCIPRMLALYLSWCSSPDAPPGSAVADLLFRPLCADGLGFKDCALSSSTLAARVRLHLTAANLYEGETVHSFRRGALQHAEDLGMSRPALMTLAQLRSEAVLERYLDRHRHESSSRRPRLD